MEYPISRVARMAGVSARTLRHYDEIGILAPAHVAANGYRWYGRRELLRLQRIMLLRKLGMPLATIAEALDGETDELAALCHHREQLAAERDRLDRILGTVDRTIAGLRGGPSTSDADFFVGLAEAKDRLRADLHVRYGERAESHLTHAERVTAGWTREDHERAAEQGRRLLTRMAQARQSGVDPHDEQALDLVSEHYQGVRALWPADAAAYHALGDLLLDNPEQRAMIAAVDPDLPAWLSAAVQSYAAHRLGHRLG